MRYFPIFVDTENLNCLIVGAGEVAARKLELLLKSHANVTVIAPEICHTIHHYKDHPNVTLIARPFEDSDLNDQNLVFAATNDSNINQRVSKLAKAQSILVNVVDNTPLCGFITPSIIDRSPLVVALSSGGNAPVLLRYLRQKLESLIPANLSRLGRFSEKFREKVKSTLDNVTQRRYFWENVLEGDIAEEIVNGNIDEAEEKFLNALSQAKEDKKTQGQVYLVGAGPGDPDLLTFRALRLMQKADVVVYDKLVSAEILELVRRDAEKIYVGKTKSHHTLVQEDINALIAREAKAGNRVVRLKGGDPFIFGRGGEEIQTLIKEGVDFQVVPGITAASGAATYGGIPLTHRDHAHSVVFSTGHLKNETIDLNWSALAQPNQTLVFYMGLTGLGVICKQLIAHGLPEDTPIGLIQSATQANQKVVTGTLLTIEQNPQTKTLKTPTLIIVGNVVSLQQELSWFTPS